MYVSNSTLCPVCDVSPLLCRSVVLIDGGAFYYSGLLDVTVPSSVTFLGQVILSLKMITSFTLSYPYLYVHS